MPRKKFYRSSEHPYHVTARIANQERFGVSMENVWCVFTEQLQFIWRVHGLGIHSFVLMSNHFHMLATAPNGNLEEAINYLLNAVIAGLSEKSGKNHQAFEKPHSSLIKNSVHYHHAYKYIYRNPIHAGMCTRVQDYPYSTLRGLLGMDALQIPACDNLRLIHNPHKQLEWLNDEYEPETQSAIRFALRKAEFSFPPDEATQRNHYLESHIV